MKKFKILFVSILVCICLSTVCFAQELKTVRFVDYFYLNGGSIKGVSSSLFNVQTNNESDDLYVSFVRQAGDTNVSLDTWIINIVSTDDFDDHSRRHLKNGDMITFDMRFEINNLNVPVSAFQEAKFYLYKMGVDRYTPDEHYGTTNVNIVRDTSAEGVFYLDFTFSFNNNTGSNINNCQFFLYFNLYNNQTISLPTFVNIFAEELTNFYWGNPSGNPYLPSAQNPSDTIGNDANELKGLEDNLNNETLQGREDTFNFFNSFFDVVLPFSMSMLAISQVFNYLISNTIFESVLYVSITLGLVMLILNIIPSIFNKQDRLNRKKQVKTSKSSNRKKGG